LNLAFQCINFCLWVWLKSEDCERKVDKPDEMLAGILDAAACIKGHEDQPRRKTLDVLTRIAKCFEIGENF
jgi:hypothetical protein